jgi:hypothetical protein
MIKKRFVKLISTHKCKELFILISIFVFSLVIRTISIKHGFPLLTHPDEAVIIDRVFNMTLARTLNPGSFSRPNQILYLINFFYLNILSYLRFGESLASAFPNCYLSFYAYARFLISVIGSMIPIVAYKIGNELRPNFGLPAALVFAFFPSYVMHSLFITPDVPITLFTLVVMYFTILYLNRQEEKFLYIAVIFAAINTAEKYPGLISLGIVFSGIIFISVDQPDHSFRKRLWSIVKRILKATFIFIVILFLVAPYLFIEYEAVIEALIVESRTTHLGADNLGWGGNLLFYLRSFGSWTNILSILFISLGMFAIIKWRNKTALILFYGALYWVLLSSLSLHWERWALPMYITPLFLIAAGISFLVSKVKNHRLMTWGAALLLMVFFTLQLITTIHTSIRMTFTDTREVALNYCNELGITSENSIFEGYSPFLPQGPKFITREELRNDDQYNYIILSSHMYDRISDEPDTYLDQVLTYQDIRNDFRLLAKISPRTPPENYFEKINEIVYFVRQRLNWTSTHLYRGPVIEIYQVND